MKLQVFFQAVQLLQKKLSTKWCAIQGVATTAALFLAINVSGCKSQQNTTTQPPSTSKSIAVVAPVFEHGDGRGVTGSILTTPPVFLTEEEGLQVLRDELAEVGVELSKQAVEVNGVRIGERHEGP